MTYNIKKSSGIPDYANQYIGNQVFTVYGLTYNINVGSTTAASWATLSN